MSNENSTTFGIIGTVVAAILSFKTFASIGWAIVAGLFGWLYVIYWAVKYWN